jgi:integrin beta 2
MPINNLYSVNVSAKLDLSNVKEDGFQLRDVTVLSKNKPKENILKSLALDWINNKIYLIENDMIKAMNVDGNGKKTILDAGRNSWDLILDPTSRQVIWSTMLRIIYIASMDGSSKRVLIYENVEFASGLAIDQPARRLYWCDIRKSTIETTLLDGSDRHIIRQYKSLDLYGLPIGPFKLDVFEDELFVVFSNQTIYKMNKFGKPNRDEEVFHGVYLHKSSHLKIVHPLLRNAVINNPCTKNPCDQSAICLLSTNQLERTCTCPDDKIDILKNKETVSCVEKYTVAGACSKKCFNNGKCQFEGGFQKCVCPPKYEGDQCEHYICSGHCSNNGVCLLPSDKILASMTLEEAKNQRRCKCKNEWTGETCSIPMKLCQSLCHNGGTCHYITLNNGTIKEQCTCPLNFSGNKCENCASLQCFNGGICRESALSMYICDCNDRFTGRHCEIDKCEGYCKNDGLCLIDQVKGPSCKCFDNYSGEKCELDNQCKDFCMNGGTCLRFGRNATVCRCLDQYTGNRCEKLNCQYYPTSEDCASTHSPVDLCLEQIQCENNGICKIDSDGIASCLCVGEWTGKACNFPPLCVNDECGKCNEQSSINECTCKNGLIQPCLISDSFPHDGYVSSTEIVTTSHDKIPYIMILVFVLCFLSTSIFVMGVYIKRWLQRNRFFAHSRLLNETNVEEITNPIFEYSATEVDDSTDTAPGAPLQNFGNDSKVS